MSIRTRVVKAASVLALIAAQAAAAAAFETKAYDEATFKAVQASGAPVVVHVTAPWCPTCKAQHQTLNELGKKAEFAKVAVFNVDFDTQKDALKAFKAQSQSTIIVFKGATETGRVVGATKPDAIAPVVQSALK